MKLLPTPLYVLKLVGFSHGKEAQYWLLHWNSEGIWTWCVGGKHPPQPQRAYLIDLSQYENESSVKLLNTVFGCL